MSLMTLDIEFLWRMWESEASTRQCKYVINSFIKYNLGERMKNFKCQQQSI